MASPAPSSLFRRASYWLLGLALFTIALYAVQRTLLLRRQQLRAQQRRSQQELSTLVDLWEGLLADRISSWVSDLTVVDDLGTRDRQLRQTVPWFNGMYLWRSDDPTPASSPPTLLYPQAPLPEDTERLLSSACMREARGHAVIGARLRAAREFLECMESADEPTQLLASSMAASLLLVEDQPEDAWEALNQASPPLRLPLARARSRGVSLKRLLTRRSQGVDTLQALNRTDRQRSLQVQTIRDITTLSGPALQVALPTARRLMNHLRPDGSNAPIESADLLLLQARLDAATQRFDGYTEVTQRLVQRPIPGSRPDGAPAVEVMHVNAQGQGYLLAYARVPDTDRVVAFQIQVDELLTALIESTPHQHSYPDLVILNSQGDTLRGLRAGPDGTPPALWAEVPFRRLIPQYRLGMVRAPDSTEHTQLWWVFSQLAPIGIALMLGIIAVVGRSRADHQQTELYERQRAFIARITHELKTPLAGIRVMAETLDIVGLSDKTSSFPRRIVREVERLDQRITEVLTVARRPEVSPRTPIAPDKLAADLVQHWRPRFEAIGARIDTDFKPCATIAADPALLRDALNNLLDNALKYLREDRVGLVRFRTGEVGRWVVFEVTDNGIGVPPAMRKKIFERFTRVEGSGRGKAGGYGLGLSFVAEAAAAHGGLVECLDGIDGGARFRLKVRRR